MKNSGKPVKIILLLINLLSVLIFTFSEKLHDYIQEVRASRGGSLSGLSINEVINLASERIFARQQNSAGAKPVAHLVSFDFDLINMIIHVGHHSSKIKGTVPASSK